MSSVIEKIPLELIHPFAGQPRKYFDTASLEELALSIQENGQITPAWVEPAGKGQYQLIAGERRWRACKIAKVPTLICEIRTGLSENKRYLASVMENFGRKDCTTMETARAVAAVLKINSDNYEKAATVFARSSAWVRQYVSLLKLDPQVASMLEPPNMTLTMSAALMLANLHRAKQIQLADEIIQFGLKYRAALRHISNSVGDSDRVSQRGRARKPSDDSELLQRLLSASGPLIDALTGLDGARIVAMVDSKSAKDMTGLCSGLRQRTRQFEALADRIEKHIVKAAK